MNREQLRQTLLSSGQKLMDTPLAWRFLSAAQQKLVRASMDFWTATTDVTNSALDQLVALYNQQQNKED